MKVLSKSFLPVLLLGLIAALPGSLLATQPIDPYAGIGTPVNGYLLRNGACWLVIDGKETIELDYVARPDVLERIWTFNGNRPSVRGTFIGGRHSGNWVVIREAIAITGGKEKFSKIPFENLDPANNDYVLHAAITDSSGGNGFPFTGGATFADLPIGKLPEGLTPIVAKQKSKSSDDVMDFDAPNQSPKQKTKIVDPFDPDKYLADKKQQESATPPAGFVLDKPSAENNNRDGGVILIRVDPFIWGISITIICTLILSIWWAVKNGNNHPQQASSGPNNQRYPMSKQYRLITTVLFVIALGGGLATYNVYNNFGGDMQRIANYKAHPEAVILGSMVPALLLAPVFYWLIGRWWRIRRGNSLMKNNGRYSFLDCLCLLVVSPILGFMCAGLLWICIEWIIVLLLPGWVISNSYESIKTIILLWGGGIAGVIGAIFVIHENLSRAK